MSKHDKAHKSAKKRKRFHQGANWSDNYNDHFETPLVAFQDASILVDWIVRQNNKNHKTNDLRSNVTLYDPYYCNGRSKRLLCDELGYQNIIHEKRDFYLDIANDTVPDHDVLITNPPYSDEHKKKCLSFCIEQYKSKKIPFMILMPAYVAARKYYRDLLGEASGRDGSTIMLSMVYLLPPAHKGPYEYEHPEGTGKDDAPFESCWFCSVSSDRLSALREFWKKQQQETLTPSMRSMPRLAFSVQELADMKVIAPLEGRRLNPRQRRKKRRREQQQQQQQQQQIEAAASTTASIPSLHQKNQGHDHDGDRRKKPKKSKCRDEHGIRTKKRF